MVAEHPPHGAHRRQRLHPRREEPQQTLGLVLTVKVAGLGVGFEFGVELGLPETRNPEPGTRNLPMSDEAMGQLRKRMLLHALLHRKANLQEHFRALRAAWNVSFFGMLDECLKERVHVNDETVFETRNTTMVG